MNKIAVINEKYYIDCEPDSVRRLWNRAVATVVINAPKEELTDKNEDMFYDTAVKKLFKELKNYKMYERR